MSRRKLSEDPADVPEAEVQRILTVCGVPFRYLGSDLGLIPDGLRFKKSLLKYVRLLPRLADAGRGVLLYGPYGSGKTSAAVAILKSVICRGGQVYYVSVRDLDKLSYSLDREDVKRMSLVKTSQFLVMDELGIDITGSEKRNERLNRVQQDVIRVRYDNRLPTIITSNLDVVHLSSAYQDAATILFDQSSYGMVEISGTNWRAEEEEL